MNGNCYICGEEGGADGSWEGYRLYKAASDLVIERMGTKYVCRRCLFFISGIRMYLTKRDITPDGILYWKLKTYFMNELRKGNYEVLYVL